MNAFTKVATQSAVFGTCKGMIDGKEPFDAGMVELSEATYPLPHGEAYVMLATQRDSAPDYTTKELKISFSKGHKDGSYGLYPDFYTVRVLFIDSAVPTKPVVYDQFQGIARVAYDPSTLTFSGEISVLLENLDEDTRKTVDLKVEFEAHPVVRARRVPRRPSSPAAHC
jgi:hypothetical protein